MSTLNLLQSFAKQAQTNPDALALSVDKQEYTYVELLNTIQKFAGWIVSKRSSVEFRVGILVDRNFEGYAASYASFWSGSCYVPLNPKHPVERLKNIVCRAQLSAIIVDNKYVSVLQATLANDSTIPVLIHNTKNSGTTTWDSLQELEKINPLIKPEAVNKDDDAYIMFTSGTTGEPKGILASVDNLQHYLRFMQNRYHIQSTDRLSQLFELSFDASLFDILMSINHGASFHSVPDSQMLAPSKFITEKSLSIWFGVPSNIAFMQKMNLLSANCFPKIRAAIFGGEPMTITSMQAWLNAAPNSTLDNVYGPTEATVTCFIQECHASSPVTDHRRIMAIGRPYTGTLGAIVDDQGNFLPRGEQGEIVIAGPQVTIGYWHNRTLTKARYREIKHTEYGLQRWYFTGDLGLEDHNGIFHHLGRIDNQIKIAGHRIELEEIDSALRNAASTDVVAAVPWPIVNDLPQGITAFVCKSPLQVPEIRHNLQQKLPHYMIPRRIIMTDTLPYTLNGKVDRKALALQLEEKT